MEEPKWYVAHTFSGYENKVASNILTVVENRNLHDLIFEVVNILPMVQMEVWQNGEPPDLLLVRQQVS